MYDYIELRSDKNYSKYLSVTELSEFLLLNDRIERISNAGFVLTIDKVRFKVQGILCSSYGDYSFNSDKRFKRVNLIEINLPQGSEFVYDSKIRSFANQLAEKFFWEVNWRDD